MSRPRRNDAPASTTGCLGLALIFTALFLLLATVGVILLINIGRVTN